MKTILITLPINDRQKDIFNEIDGNIELIYCNDDELTQEIVHTANAIIGNVSSDLIKGTIKLEWIQLSSAGADEYLKKGLLPANTIVTNSTGAYGISVSEHIFALLLFLIKKLNKYSVNQKEHIWKDDGQVSSVYGSTTVIVGLGNLGNELAIRMKSFGSYIIGIKRTIGDKPESVDEIYTIDDLDTQLARADIVALCLPGTKGTFRLFDKDRLLKIKKGAILLNVGRGNVLDTEVLSEILESGHLAGAGIDVTNIEPLPFDSKLWNAPNTLITPHVAGGYHILETLERIVKISSKNLKAFCGSGEFTSVVDFDTGYKISNKE